MNVYGCENVFTCSLRLLNVKLNNGGHKGNIYAYLKHSLGDLMNLVSLTH